MTVQTKTAAQNGYIGLTVQAGILSGGSIKWLDASRNVLVSFPTPTWTQDNARAAPSVVAVLGGTLPLVAMATAAGTVAIVQICAAGNVSLFEFNAVGDGYTINNPVITVGKVCHHQTMSIGIGETQ